MKRKSRRGPLCMHLTEADRETIAYIQRRYGYGTMAAAVRHGLRMAEFVDRATITLTPAPGDVPPRPGGP